MCESAVCVDVIPSVALRNVLIDSNGKMLICDFGLSKVMHTGKDGNVYASHVQGTAVPFQMYVRWVVVFSSCVPVLVCQPPA
jgi:hypothetical protein